MQIKNEYTFIDKVKLFWWLILTKLQFPKTRLIRRPIDVRGRRYIDWGHQLTTGKYCRLEAWSKDNKRVLVFGNNVQLNDNVHISAMQNVLIGNNVLMASHIYISDNSHGCYRDNFVVSSPDIPPLKRSYTCADVIIEDNVWIGEHVVILPGVRIGYGAIIGANSVVTHDITAESIAVGQPAKIVKRYNRESNTWKKL